MASWILASQFFLIALLCLNVYSLPAKKGWSQHNPGSSDVAVNPGLQNARSLGVQPRSAVLWVTARPKQLFSMQLSNSQSPPDLLVTSPPATLPPPSNPEGPAVSEVDSTLKVPPPLVVQQLPPVSWMTLPSKNFYPTRKFVPSITQKVAIPWFTDPPKSLIASPSKPEVALPVPSAQEAPDSWLGYPPKKTSPPSPEDPVVSLFSSTYNPEVYESGSDFSDKPNQGSSAQLLSSYQFTPNSQADERDETEKLSSGLPPLTYPAPMFQGGHLHNYESLYEQGNLERETEDNGFVPMYPYAAELNRPFISMGGMLPQYPYMRPVVPNLFYYFLTGQLPHGTVSHTQTDYEAGGDHTTDFGYERYRSTSAKNPDNPSQIKVSTMQL